MIGAEWQPAARVAPPRYDDAALLGWFDRVDPGPTIRAGLSRSDLPPIPPPEWNREALTRLFGLARASHCFHAAPHVWAGFHEPQITRGFAHFLNEGSSAQRLARAIALVKAALSCAGKDPALADNFDANTAYTAAEENRTDLLVELRGAGRKIGASVEAKFNHRLTRRQLPKAMKYVRDERGWTLGGSALLVVTPGRANPRDAILRNYRNAEWRATDWASLILAIETFTDAQWDGEDYRRFRRTVWHRAH